jgi:hypothetical protein
VASQANATDFYFNTAKFHEEEDEEEEAMDGLPDTASSDIIYLSYITLYHAVLIGKTNRQDKYYKEKV